MCVYRFNHNIIIMNLRRAASSATQVFDIVSQRTTAVKHAHNITVIAAQV